MTEQAAPASPVATFREVELRWRGGVAFEAQGRGGVSLAIDQPADKGGGGQGFSPMELLLHALGSCLATTVVEILAKQRRELTGYEIRVRGERAPDPPRRYTAILVEHRFRGADLDRDNLEHVVALVEEKYCSVSATLQPGLVEQKVLLEQAAPGG